MGFLLAGLVGSLACGQDGGDGVGSVDAEDGAAGSALRIVAFCFRCTASKITFSDSHAKFRGSPSPFADIFLKSCLSSIISSLLHSMKKFRASMMESQKRILRFGPNGSSSEAMAARVLINHPDDGRVALRTQPGANNAPRTPLWRECLS